MRKVILASRLSLVVGGVLGYAAHEALFRRFQEVAPALGSAGKAEEGGRVIARIGAYELTERAFRTRWEDLMTEEGRDFHREKGGASSYLDEVVEEKLLAQEAWARGYQDEYETQLRLEVEGDRILARPLLRDEVRAKAFPEEEIRSYYEAHREEFHQPEQVRLSHIVVTPAPLPEFREPWNLSGDDASNEEEARAKIEALRERLEKGEDFAEVARRFSEDATAAAGGDLGYFVRGGGLRPEVEEAAFALAPGELSDVIETDAGFHLIRVAEHLPERQLPLGEVREAIVAILLQADPGAEGERYREFVEELREHYPVETYVDSEWLQRIH
jgi:hypothetical protein